MDTSNQLPLTPGGGVSGPVGSVIIGSEVCAGHARFGIFSSCGFTPLPALPNSLPVPVGVLAGTFAW